MTAQEDPWGGIVAKCWEDEAFKARLLADPAATLREEGVELPKGVTVSVALDSEDVRTLVIPRSPSLALTDEELAIVAGSHGCLPQSLDPNYLG
ncbi:MAG: NHLP leader peptide family RiPP precursor [Actinomycetes bacterium]